MNRAALVFLVLSFCASALAAPPLEETIEQTYPVGEKPTLSVRNTDGRITIYGSEKNEIQIRARKRAYTQERLAAIHPVVSMEGDTVTIETSYPPKSSGLSREDRSGTVDYVIIVPQRCTVSRAELANGEIVIEGLRESAIDARLGNGKITVLDCFSSTQVSVAAGGIEASWDWWEKTSFRFSSEIANGDVRIGFPPNVVASVNAESVTGHVWSGFNGDATKQGHVQSMQTVLGEGSGAALQLRATNGNIKIGKLY